MRTSGGCAPAPSVGSASAERLRRRRRDRRGRRGFLGHRARHPPGAHRDPDPLVGARAGDRRWHPGTAPEPRVHARLRPAARRRGDRRHRGGGGRRRGHRDGRAFGILRGDAGERARPPRPHHRLRDQGLRSMRHARMSELVAERLPEARVAALSGPTFAREVALGTPTAAVIAAADDALTSLLQARLGARAFRLYANRDIVGVEAGGALKNVVALATGLSDGLGLGENARAALVTRGLAEMTRLAVALGGEPTTLAGLAGMGDLVLTSTGTLSRNRSLGMALARGDSLTAASAKTRMVAEGVPTVRSALALARRHGVALPLCAEVAAVLFDGKPAADALASLLGRAPTREDAPVEGRRA